MHRLNLPAIDGEHLYDAISAAKSRARGAPLRQVRTNVIASWAAYATVAPEVGRLPPVALTTEQSEALIHAYTVETKPMTRLREDLLGPAATVRCPFCGMGETSTLDHYLPKDRQPQYAVFPGNLVPCCAACNTRKGSAAVDERTGDRLFLHPYYDVFPGQAVVDVRVDLAADALGIAFRVRQPVGMDDAAFRRMSSHFGLLGLADRYRRMSLAHLREERKALARFSSTGGAPRVAAELASQADAWEADLGCNHWRVALYRALSSHDAFCDRGFEVLARVQ